MTEPWQLSMCDAAARIRSGELSPLELAASVLERIDEREPVVGAFVSLDPDAVMSRASVSTEALARREYAGPLHGVPVTLKDLYDWRGLPTTASSRTMSRAPAARDSEVAWRLRAAGAVLLGKVHTHEHAYGAVTPTTRNPRDPTRIPGGSSGGSAAAVAAGFGCLSVGTDTAGSVRIPSSLCGVVGLKPTYGSIGAAGLRPLSWSLDHAGPIARTVTDVEAGLDVLRSTELRPALDAPVVGIPSSHFFEGCEPGVVEAVRSTADRLAAEGLAVQDVRVRLVPEALAVGREIMAIEAAATHARTLAESADLLDGEVRLKLEVGALGSAEDYLRALRAREVVKRAWAEAFAEVDVLLTPTTPFTAPAVGETHLAHPDGTLEELGAALTRFTMPVNVTGLPALTVPCGEVSGRPAGAQLIGRPYSERTLFALGAVIERASG